MYSVPRWWYRCSRCGFPPASIRYPARTLGIDPIEIRRRNYIPSAAMPHKLQTGITYDSGDFVHVMDECLKLADWNGFNKRAGESKKRGKLRGRGIGYF